MDLPTRIRSGNPLKVQSVRFHVVVLDWEYWYWYHSAMMMQFSCITSCLSSSLYHICFINLKSTFIITFRLSLISYTSVQHGICVLCALMNCYSKLLLFPWYQAWVSFSSSLSIDISRRFVSTYKNLQLTTIFPMNFRGHTDVFPNIWLGLTRYHRVVLPS